jgi:PAS domain S-box-containing protein
MPSFYAFLLLFSFFICSIIGCFVYFSSSRKPVHTTFMFLCLANAYLAFSEFMMNQATDLHVAICWAKVYSFWVIVVAVALHFILVYTGRGRIFHRWWTWIAIYGPFLAFPIIGLVQYDASSIVINKQSWGISFASAPMHWYGALLILPVAVYGYAGAIIAIVYFFRMKNPLLKKQASYVAMGYISTSVLSLISGIFPIMAGMALPDITAFGAALQEILIGLAIWRFNLFELSPATAANNIISTMSDMMVIANSLGCVVSVNSATIRSLGYEEADLLKSPIQNILRAEVSNAMLETSHSGDPALQADKSDIIRVGHFDSMFTAKDGRTIPVDIVVSRLLEGNGCLAGYVLIARDMTEWKRAEAEKNALIARLQDALANIKTLKGLIPICASCKKVRNDEGFWQMVEEYISERSEADFSHAICEDCFRKLYPEFLDALDEK